MICPKCGNDSASNDTCTRCKTDIKQFIKFDNKSVSYYNKGLEFALNNNISRAIEMLEKSVKYNHANITALNLLGLCYDRVGRVADASKNWVLSCFVDADNVAADYLEKVDKKPSQREKINDTIKMYNKALDYVKQDSEDIAIIQLKKAVDINENFVEALNLLTLCYIRTNSNELALKYCKRVLDIDVGNPTALKYSAHLGYNSVANVKSGKTKPAPSRNLPQKSLGVEFNGGRKKSNGSITTALGFLVGALCISLFVFYLILPAVENNAKISMSDMAEQHQEEKKQWEEQMQSKEDEINELNLKNKTLSEENQANFEAYNYVKAVNEVRTANDLFKERNYIAAAITISEIEDQYVVGDDIDTYRTVREGTYARASQELYQKGVGEYDNKLYNESLDSLNKSIFLGGEETNYYDDILYYMGRNYEGLQDIDKALEYYNRILNEYPNSDFTSKTRSRLNVINQ